MLARCGSRPLLDLLQWWSAVTHGRRRRCGSRPLLDLLQCSRDTAPHFQTSLRIAAASRFATVLRERMAFQVSLRIAAASRFATVTVDQATAPLRLRIAAASRFATVRLRSGQPQVGCGSRPLLDLPTVTRARSPR